MKDENKEQETFKIPDVAYNIPLNEFLNWYDDKLTTDWDKMSLYDTEMYFKNKNKESLGKELRRGLKNAGGDAKSLEKVIAHLDIKQINKIYFRIIEFQRLENDMAYLKKCVSQFLVLKSVKKMAENNENSDTLENYSKFGTVTGRIGTSLPNMPYAWKRPI